MGRCLEHVTSMSDKGQRLSTKPMKLEDTKGLKALMCLRGRQYVLELTVNLQRSPLKSWKVLQLKLNSGLGTHIVGCEKKMQLTRNIAWLLVTRQSLRRKQSLWGGILSDIRKLNPHYYQMKCF